MQSPIFHSKTMFPAPSDQGRALVSGESQPQLFDGVRVQLLEGTFNLVEIETESGAKLRLTPESIFALSKDNGKAILFNPPDLSFAEIKATPWKYRIIDLDQDYRRWFIMGMIVAAGTFSGDVTRPLRIVIPNSAKGVSYAVAQFLNKISTFPELLTKYDTTYAVTTQPVGDRTVVASRVLDRLVGKFIEPKTHRLFFDPLHLTPKLLHAFISGLLRALPPSPEGNRAFVHRDSYVVELIYHALHDRMGIPVYLSIDPMEPRFQKGGKATGKQHHLVVPAWANGICAKLGVLDKEREPSPYFGIRKEEIKKVTPIGDHPACAVIADEDAPETATANWFLFRPRFEVNPVITDMATSENFEDLSEPPKRMNYADRVASQKAQAERDAAEVSE